MAIDREELDWKKAAGAAGVVGVIAAVLQKMGNPDNLGLGIALMEADIAGAVGLHRAEGAQYLRPEVIGIGLGALAVSLGTRKFRVRGGSATLVRFILGYFAVVGALVFLGGPWRALLRLAGGDWGALFGLSGLLAGVGVGAYFLKSGFMMEPQRPMFRPSGIIFSVFMVMLLFYALRKPEFSSGAIFESTRGPASEHAPLALSLAAGLILGGLLQRTRFCTIRMMGDLFLRPGTGAVVALAALPAAAFLVNLVSGQFHPGLHGQPLAHSAFFWSFLGMTLCGLTFTMAGGDPARQLVLAGEGDMDAAAFVFGMLAGAAFAHNLDLASSSLGPGSWGPRMVVLGIVVVSSFGLMMKEERWLKLVERAEEEKGQRHRGTKAQRGEN